MCAIERGAQCGSFELPSMFLRRLARILWLKEVDGEVFAKDTEPQGKEKTEDANLAVICEFPSMRAAVEAYESEEYKELSNLRKEATENSTFTIMEGLDEAAKLRRAMGK